MSASAVTTAVQGRTLVVTLNRPEARNAIDSDVSLGLIDALRQLDDDPALRVGILTGSGGTFCAGLDLKAFARAGLPRRIGSLYRHGARKPLVAAIADVAHAPLGVEASKELLRRSPGLSEEELWKAQVELVDRVFTSEDAKEGARAFAERRAPAWRGR